MAHLEHSSSASAAPPALDLGLPKNGVERELQLLADVGNLLSSTLDPDERLAKLTRLVVPMFADWCAIDLVRKDGSIRRVAVHHPDPQRVEFAHEIQRRYPPDPNAPTGVPAVLRTGQTEFVREFDDRLLDNMGLPAEDVKLFKSLQIRSYVVVPLSARGENFGALTLVYAESRRRYTDADLPLAREIASRAALAVDNARLYAEAQAAAEVMRRRQSELALSAAVGAAFASASSLPDMLRGCTDAIVEHLGGAFARIWTHNQRTATLELQASSGQYTHVDGPHARVPVGKFKIGKIAEERKPHLTNDVQHDPRVGDREWAKREGMVAFAGYPLLLEGRVLGVMAMFAKRPLSDDTLAGLAAVANSLSVAIERKRAELRAQEESETLEIVNEVGRTISAELDSEKLVQAVTDSATRLTGAEFGAFFYNVIDERGESYTLYSISGVPKEAFSKFPMPRNTAIFAPTFAGEGIVRSDDITQDPRFGKNAPYHGMPKGHLPVVSYLAVPVVSREGRVIGGLFFGHKKTGVFTERAEKLAAGVASIAAVAMDNARLFTQAQRLIGALERSNAELDQFAYVTSHDLKAPLRGISNLSQWIEEDLGQAMTPDSKKQMDLLRKRVQRMEGLIDGILTYSRAGRVKEAREEVKVGPLIEEVIELATPKAPARVVLDGAFPTVFTERIPLQQIFLNLVGNALKHAGKPDVTVTVKATGEDGDFHQFTVSDDGKGVAPEFHERIWGIFQTLEARDKVEGTGIGLSIVKKVVERRGGKAWIESNVGQGAKFHFTWPKKESGLS